jgi:2-iminobutanoate/2-iminopropanoate deaminase
MAKEIISTNNAPAAVGPYSQAVRVGNLVYTAGQVAIDPAVGKLVGEDAPAQAEQALRNLKAVLEAAGSSLENVVKTTVFLDSMDDYKAVNEVYGRFFTQNPPARSAVEVARLPLGALVEIEAVAVIE